MRTLLEGNIREIERLSQRGKTLSIVELINDKTLNIQMASYLFYIMANGASFLTAAKPGNAGKTTLMACLLMYLPPHARIATVTDPSAMEQISPVNRDEHTYYLCHEIGSGPWFGYLWGHDVKTLFNLMKERQSIASCIHADTLDELREILCSEELNIAEEDFRQLNVILFMHLEQRGYKYTRRVSAVYEATGAPPGQGKSHQPLFIWNRKEDTFHQQADSLLLQALEQKKGLSREQIHEQLAECEDFMRWLVSIRLRLLNPRVSRQVTDYREIYQEIARFYERYPIHR